MSRFLKELINFTTQTKTRKMKKITVDLSQIPAWGIGKWYFLAKEGVAGWFNLSEIKKGEYYPLSLMSPFGGRTATIDGRHSAKDGIRTVLEPWEAAILYPECKATAPNGVDWSAPELTLPKCLTKDEFEALEDDTMIFWCGNSFVQDGPKNGLGFWSGNDLESGFFLTEPEAETFKELYEADEIEFTGDIWVMKQSENAAVNDFIATDAILDFRKIIQDLEAKNTELLAENQSLENYCDSYEKENLDLRGVVESLTAQNKSIETSLDRSLSKFEKTAQELMYAKEIIVNLAIRLQAHEDF